MLDDLAGKRTGERIQILRERRGLSRPVLAGLVGMSASWLKGIEQGRRLPPRLPVLVKLAEALAVGMLRCWQVRTWTWAGRVRFRWRRLPGSRMRRSPRSAMR